MQGTCHMGRRLCLLILLAASSQTFSSATQFRLTGRSLHDGCEAWLVSADGCVRSDGAQGGFVAKQTALWARKEPGVMPVLRQH